MAPRWEAPSGTPPKEERPTACRVPDMPEKISIMRELRRRNSSACGQPPDHMVELIEASVVDVQDTPLIPVVDGDAQAQRIGQTLFQSERIRVLLDTRLARLLPRLLALAAGDFFHLAHVQAARDDVVGHFLGIGLPDQRAGVTGRELPR